MPTVRNCLEGAAKSRCHVWLYEGVRNDTDTPLSEFTDAVRKPSSGVKNSACPPDTQSP